MNNMIKIQRTFGEYFKYSLHDARILKIEHIEDNLILHFDYVFSYNKNGTENTHKARIIFEKVEIEDVNFLVFHSKMQKYFTGILIYLDEYQEEYQDCEFEVIVETYNYGRATFQGILRNDESVHCIMNIYYTGKMIYEVEE